MSLELSILLSVFALSVGSFVNSFIYRFPLIDSNQDLNLFKPRSFCPKCKGSLRPFMLIPIISYIYLKGNCGFCNKKISPSYLIHELFHLVLMALVIVFGSWNKIFFKSQNLNYINLSFKNIEKKTEIEKIFNTINTSQSIIRGKTNPKKTQTDLVLKILHFNTPQNHQYYKQPNTMSLFR